MEVKKINESLYLTNSKAPAQDTQTKKPMFSTDFNPDDGIQVEKQETQQDTPKTYTKNTKDSYGNDVVLTYRSKDDALISREIKYDYGYTRTEYIKAGTNIIEKAEEKNTEGVIISRDFYYNESPFGKKQTEEINPDNGKTETILYYKNAEESPYAKTIYEDGFTTKMELLDGEPEVTTVYRKDGSIEQHIEPVVAQYGEKRYENTMYREDGTMYSQGIYADPYGIIPLEETDYFFDGKTVSAKRHIGSDGLMYHENYDENSVLRTTEIYNATSTSLKERTIYDKNGEKYIYTKYNSDGEITEYVKNENSIANQPFQEKLLNGKIDTSFKQGQAGTCYIASTVRSMLSTPKGREILNNTVKYNPQNNTSTISFKGVDKEYTFSKEEIEHAMGRLGTGDPDFTAFLLGYEQYRTEEKKKNIDGGLGSEVIEVLTGLQADSNLIFDSLCENLDNTTLDALEYEMSTKQLVITAGTPPKSITTEFSEKDNKRGLANSHAYCIKQITPDSVYIIEPTADKEIKISREEFLEKFTSYFAVDLEAGE